MRKEGDNMVNAKVIGGNEELTGAVTNINSDHAVIHMGFGYKAHFEIETFASGASPIYYLIKTGNLYGHFKSLQLSGQGSNVKASIYQNPAVSADGAADATILGVSNLNANSESVTQFTITANPTVTDDGDFWDGTIIYGNTTNLSSSSSSTQQNPNEELVMAPNSSYLIKLENVKDDDCNYVRLIAFWYEETRGLS